MSEKMTDGEKSAAGAGAFLASCVWACVLAITCAGLTDCRRHEVQNLKAKAVELGAAEWHVDPKTGTTTFQWREAKP